MESRTKPSSRGMLADIIRDMRDKLENAFDGYHCFLPILKLQCLLLKLKKFLELLHQFLCRFVAVLLFFEKLLHVSYVII